MLELYAATRWAADRTEADVVRMLAAGDVVFALVDPATDRLAAFARGLTADTYFAQGSDAGRLGGG